MTRRRPEMMYARGQTFISLDDYIDLLMSWGDYKVAAQIIGDILGAPDSWAEIDDRIAQCRENAKRVRENDQKCERLENKPEET